MSVPWDIYTEIVGDDQSNQNFTQSEDPQRGSAGGGFVWQRIAKTGSRRGDKTIDKETWNATCILVDEANLVLPGDDEAQTRKALQYVVMLTKETSQPSVVLISSEFAYPYHLQEAGMNLLDIKNIIVANEIQKEELVEIMVTNGRCAKNSQRSSIFTLVEMLTYANGL